MTYAPLILLLTLQAADALTTYRLLSDGGRELNPLVAYLIAKLGLVPALLISKGAVVGLLLAFTLNAPNWFPLILCALYTAVVFHNIKELRK